MDVNDLGAIQIGLASPEEIRKWSRGEVKKPETINYRTLKPEKDGLFCEKIFGPTKDWECYCGKYKRVKDKGMVCDRCGVEITKASVRRERLGHIELAAPVSHIWYFKSIPSKMALLLGIVPKNLEKVLYFASGRKRDDCYTIVDPGSTEFKPRTIIRDTEYKIYSKYDPAFRAEPAHQITEVHALPFSVGDQLSIKDYTRYRSKYKESFDAEAIDEEHFQVMDVFSDRTRDEVFSESEIEQMKEVFYELLNREELSKPEFQQLRDVFGKIWNSVVLSDFEINRLRNYFGALFEEDVIAEVVEEPCYIVIHPGQTGLKVSQMILETEARLLSRYDPEFKAGVGAEAVREILKNIDVYQLARELRKELKEASGAKAKKIVKRLQVVESFCKSGNRPEWMILEVIPVLPPDLRPMVQLDGGRFATSDLNDLYRRVINRNNRLKRLLQLGAPEIIVKNEKRMLQEAVDALFDNGRRGRPVFGPGNRPLKSLSDMLRGKKGRFRQNLLGKRVDYSGRSVIVSGPRLRFDQCGIPKKMALELFKPFVMKKLVDKGFAQNIKSAKRMVEKVRDEVWGTLEEVIAEHPVLLNRAPTLHRLSIQAFQPVLVEGNAIQLHPLVCPAFNADFDGDQMAVHVPLSAEAQAEAQIIMLSSHNILSPAHGKPIAVPTQDMVLGCYYLTLMGARGQKTRMFRDVNEVLLAYFFRKLDLHEPIFVQEIFRRHPEVRETTAGRIIFNQVLPEGMPYYNEPITKKKLSEIVDLCYRNFGNLATVQLLDRVKELGFRYATRSGSTIGILDLEIPAEKTEIIEEATRRVEEINEHYNEGLITGEEREQKVIDVWTDASNKVADAILRNLSEFNPVNMMAKSGARGSIRQVSQLAGMRGLMADPSGRIIEYPIRANFREGLSVLEYFISTHGARKGLADTALRTAKSGYLTRRLVDVAQDVIVREEDCGTDEGVLLEDLRDESDNVVETFEDRVLGRIALRDIVDEKTGEVLVKANEEIDEKVIERFRERGIRSAWVRSVLTCKTRYGVCVKCYGRNLATGRLVDIGEAVGIVAAQSIGEPGTQLTMRTFHTGGIRIAGEDITQGLPRVEQLFEVRKPKKAAVLSEVDGVVERIETIGNRRKIYVRPSEDEPDQTIRTYFVPHDVRTCVVEGDTVKAGERLTLGPINPRDILKIKGIRAVQKYLLEEIQSVYVSQGVNINDKHIEVIIRQIARLNKVMVENSGNTNLLSGEMVFLEDFERENARVVEENQALLENARMLLEGRRLSEDVLGIAGEVLAKRGETLEESAIQRILSSECKSFTIEKEGSTVRVLRGYRNLEHGLSERICVEDVKDKEGKLLVKAGEVLKSALLDRIAEVGPISLRVREKTTWEKLKGAILAEDVLSRETREVVIPAHTRLDNEQIELLQKHDVEQVVVWKNVRSFPVKENLIKVVREEILGKEVAKDIVSPQTGEVIIQAGQSISRGLARRLVNEGIREIPLRDGRFFSIEGRLIEMLEQEIVGKVAAQDIMLGNNTVLIKAGEVIDREDVARIAEDNVNLLFLRDLGSEKEVKTLVEEVIYLPGLKHVATGKPIVLGITKASLAVESFLSAASFQQTTHVLADSAIKGKVDELIGLKENVIIGKVIPSGTGCSKYRKIRISTEGEAAPQRTSEAKEEDLIRDLMGVRNFYPLADEDLEEGFDVVSMEEEDLTEKEMEDFDYEDEEE